MEISCRNYKDKDFTSVKDFLTSIFGKWPVGYVFLPSRWEYIVHHPNMVPLKNEGGFGHIGIWEKDGEIVGVAHFESELGEVYLDVDPEYTFLYQEMIKYAEENLYEVKEDGQKCIEFHVPETHEELKNSLHERGYVLHSSIYEVYSGRSLSDDLFNFDLPEGLIMRNIQKKKDDEQRLRILWRGFDHEGEPDPKDLWMSDYMQCAPGYSPSLNMVIQNTEGNFVAYAGLWYDDFNKVAYVEPVCVDPDYRGQGLAKMALIEGMKRCRELGAENVYVASEIKLYKSLGFSRKGVNPSWIKKYD
ncbi:GNAT family N-acetyltransferase [Paenibacillus polymyxa]|uniref:GNAT family N-acetyltransferase n=1 Tax=Paenibacillus polymyxa TaxID=1406 RepID=UPI002ED16D1A|nr:GNAT family N-acetyltransferase [Paenibacillus polymyxa]